MAPSLYQDYEALSTPDGTNGDQFMNTYLAVKDDRVIARADSRGELCLQIMSVLVDDAGKVFIGTNQDSISYDPKQWSKEEAFRDFVRYRMKHKLPSGVEVFYCERI